MLSVLCLGYVRCVTPGLQPRHNKVKSSNGTTQKGQADRRADRMTLGHQPRSASVVAMATEACFIPSNTTTCAGPLMKIKL